MTMRLTIAALLLSTALTAPVATLAADTAALKNRAIKFIDSRTDVLAKANRDIWTFAEPGLAEFKSSQELQDLLTAEGFKVEAGIAGMPTAFVATYGSGGPVIGILAEFDALL
ncbi:MAG: amidohydrolase, partial [Rhodobacteraceae bacterium]|nr:amidohydrolase [Paracoccaceae bacterium]